MAQVLDLLLQDKSTKKKIIWATDAYEGFGSGFTDKMSLDGKILLQRPDVIRPRIEKSMEEQVQRTRKKAEVFTPAWLCNRMNNHCDEDWFGRSAVFNTENEDHTWTATEEKITFPKGKTWQDYVDSHRLEITCGEAPYLVSRYDVSTGGFIAALQQRVGILDRKLRVVNENTESYEDWLKWTFRAFESSYGYEYQGDNLLIARVNLLLTFREYYEDRWKQRPKKNLLEQVAKMISWNIWQMDGLKDTVPLGKPYEALKQLTLFELVGEKSTNEEEAEALPCKVYNWRSKSTVRFMDTKELGRMGKKLFDYVIGNPPYQDSAVGDQKTFAPPIYNDFMDGAFEVAEKVELIHPARFLFNAGSTPKQWNQKMLHDPHLKVLYYEPKSELVFPNVSLKGGVAITYRDSQKVFGPIKTFTAFPELNAMMHKVGDRPDFRPLSEIVYSRTSYRLTDALHADYPDAQFRLSKGHLYDMATNIFDSLPDVFGEVKPNDEDDYVQIYGRQNGQRVYRWIKRKYVNDVGNFSFFKVILPKSNGSGAIGEVLSTPLIGEPLIGHTETFISIGCFSTVEEATACLEYVKTKFARAMLGILKVTQDNPPEKWTYVPLQDFSSGSDIDWSKSVAEIDRQLYRKYMLAVEEIEFIESNVKEMD